MSVPGDALLFSSSSHSVELDGYPSGPVQTVVPLARIRAKSSYTTFEIVTLSMAAALSTLNDTDNDRVEHPPPLQ